MPKPASAAGALGCVVLTFPCPLNLCWFSRFVAPPDSRVLLGAPQLGLFSLEQGCLRDGVDLESPSHASTYGNRFSCLFQDASIL